MLYKEALDNDSSCYEALYNLGVIQKKQGKLFSFYFRFSRYIYKI